jgi:ParB-like chromosome segregation protein Spo0J
MTSYRPDRPAGVPPEVYARNLRLIELDRLVPSYQLPLVPERLAAITAAIRNGEALDAIVVRPWRDDCFLIVGGHHRVAASRDLGFSHIPALVEAVWRPPSSSRCGLRLG